MKKFKCTRKCLSGDDIIYVTAKDHDHALEQCMSIFYITDRVFYVQEKGWFGYKPPVIFTKRTKQK
jgi:hypothetical protein